MENSVISREIKFRAWVEYEVDKELSELFAYQEPYMAIQGEPDLETLQSFMFYYGNCKKLMQFTGLKDKKKKDIYEGDIVRGKEAGYDNIRIKGWDGMVTGEVAFSQQIGMWVYKLNGQEHQGLYYLKNPEVIGNIYQNPELLTN